MEQVVEGWPFWAVYAFFFCGALLRSHATYAVGRGLREGVGRSAARSTTGPAHIRLARRMDGPELRRAERLTVRYGPPMVTLSFLTIGVQTLLNVAAGALRMPLRHYSPAAILGSAIWAGVYTTAGFAVLDALRGDVAWWWLLVAAGLIAVMVLLTRLLRHRVDQAT